MNSFFLYFYSKFSDSDLAVCVHLLNWSGVSSRVLISSSDCLRFSVMSMVAFMVMSSVCLVWRVTPDLSHRPASFVPSCFSVDVGDLMSSKTFSTYGVMSLSVTFSHMFWYSGVFLSR